MERRRYPRISLAGDAEIAIGDTIAHGTLFNISVEGALIRLNAPAGIEAGEAVVTLSFPDAPRMPLVFRSHIIRTSPEGIAVKFLHTDFVLLNELKNFLSFNDVIIERMVQDAASQR